MAPDDRHEPVAIVGMGCRWPGGVRNVPEFWEFLKDRADGWREFDSPRFSSKGFHHPNSDRPGAMSMKGAFLVEEDARLFDHTFFGITSLEAETMDPSQRKLLEVTYEAIENSGETLESIAETRTGVFVGNFCLDHWMIQSRDWDNPRPYAFVGAGNSILANRLSYIFNLQGPSLTVDTACSSSMYALHLAVNAIRAGDCDSAIVASANWIADPGVQIALDKLGALSASSRCHTFDAKGDGYARGEGYAAIYLKKPSLAVSTGSPIRAMIRGTAMNANGRTGGITRPSAAGQEAVIREAYKNAGDLPFADTDYFECHGTGTYVGDPIEVSAVGNVFASERSSSDPLLVGSVKSNVGHAEGSSALASIMKVVLALEHGSIPPIFRLETLNPNIDFQKANVKPVTDLTPWPRQALRRASINSFGYGGANAHCIIDHVHNVLPHYIKPGLYRGGPDSSPNQTKHVSVHQIECQQSKILHHPILEAPKKTRSATASTRKLVLLPFSAHNESSLKLNVTELSQKQKNFSLADVAYTYATGRSRLSQRSFCIIDGDNCAEDIIIDRKPMRSPLQPSKIGFVFTGQGAQWHAMGNELFEYRVFRTAIDYLDQVIGALSNAPSWKIRDILSGNCQRELIRTAEVSQTACTAVQIGIVDLLASWSVRPAGVAGHSSGELAAAYAAGYVTAAEAIVAAYSRGQAVSKNKRKGSMLAVGLGPDQVSEYVRGQEADVKIAAINSSKSVTLSGEVDSIKRISEAMTRDNVFNRIVETGGNAYHSHHMVALGQDYVKILTDALSHIRSLGLIEPRQKYPRIPWSSSVKPDHNSNEFVDPVLYWRANLESPVRFSEAISNLLDQDGSSIQTLVEIGPHPALKTPLDQIVKTTGKTITYGSTLKRQQGNQESMLQLAGTLFCLNSTIDLVAVNSVDSTNGDGLVHGCTSIDLPPYQYTYGGINYHESRASKEYRFRQVLRHDLLGSKVVGTAKLRPQWRNILRLKDLPWLGDHRLLQDAILPAAGYLAMAIEAISRIHNETPAPAKILGFSLQDVSIKTSLQIPENDYGIEVLTSVELASATLTDSSRWATFSISSVSRDSEEWSEHCTGTVRIETSKPEMTNVMTITQHASRTVNKHSWYKKFAAIGLNYGPTFQPLSLVRADPERSLASAQVELNTTAQTIKGGESAYPLHPASLDGAIQLGLIACHGGRTEEANTAFVPVQLSHMYLSNDIESDSCTSIARGKRRGIRGAYLDLQMLNANNEVILHLENLRCSAYSTETKSISKDFSSPFTRLVWRPDIRILSNIQSRTMFPPPEENVARGPLWEIMNKLAYMALYDIYVKFGKLKDGPDPSGDVGHFFTWIKRRGANDRSDAMEEARSLSQQARVKMIEDLAQRAPEIPEVKIIKLLHANMADILYERRTGIDVVLSEGLLTPLYQEGLLMTGIYPQLYNILEGLSHANPNLRVLEIGGGTGGATRIAMKAFGSTNGIKGYRDYTFTDISAGFLSGARESLSGFRDFNFSVLDIEIDPLEQGYQSGYDVVIACQVLHATANMHRTLSYVKKILNPGGKLVLVETTQNFTVPGIVVGTFTGYWNGIPDGRVDSPFMSLESWDSALRKAGFTGAEIVLDDFPCPQNTTSVILSTLVDPALKLSPFSAADIQLLYSTQKPPSLVKRLGQELQECGISSCVKSLEEVAETTFPNAPVILFLDDSRVMLDANERDLQIFQNLAAKPTSMIVVTSCGIIKGRNPDGGIIPGLLRVLETENPAGKFVSIDLDAENFDVDAKDVDALVKCISNQQLALQRGLAGSESSEDNSRDREFVWQNGAMWVSRHVPDAALQSRNETGKTESLPIDIQGAVRAAFEVPGVPKSLYFEADKTMWQPLSADHIDVKVTAIGLNESDLDVWSGRSDSNFFSSEYAGVVTAVGNKSGDLKVGDRVFGLGKGQFGNYARVPGLLAHKIRQGDDDAQMASMPLACMTAIYALDRIIRLRKGQCILIQSATTAVGVAAIQLAQAKGAHVFAAIDTPAQAEFLIDNMKLPPTFVLDGKRTTDLHRAVTATRQGKGFDAVLYTAQNEPLQIYLNVLAPSGYLVNCSRGLSGQDIEAIGPQILRKNINLSSFNLWDLVENDVMLGGELIQAVDEYYRQELIGSVQAYHTTDVGQLVQMLPGSTQDQPVRKLVVTFTQPDSLVKMTPPSPTARFDPKASYLITGGLGGLGRPIIRWMSRRGARHIVLLSRRHASEVPEAKTLIDELACRGIDIKSVACDISDANQVNRVIQQVSASCPIRGVVHAAVSYLDLSFDKLSTQRWRQSLAAKVQGTKNLHNATISMPLDFFIMTTSVLSVYALATQSAYIAANNFQDMFARYRRRLGLPASTASFSLINDVGDVAMDPVTIDAFERNKTITLSEHQFLTLFEPAFLNNQSAGWAGQLQDPLSAANYLTCLDPAVMATNKREEADNRGATSTLSPRWHTDARISLIMRAFADAQANASDGTQNTSDTGSQSIITRLRRELDDKLAAEKAERSEIVSFAEQAIVTSVAEMLFISAEDVNPAKSVAGHGVDSLIAAELRNWFVQALGHNISMLDLLDPNISISALAGKIVDEKLSAKTS